MVNCNSFHATKIAKFIEKFKFTNQSYTIAKTF